MKALLLTIAVLIALPLAPWQQLSAADVQAEKTIQYQVHPIGWVRRANGSTTLEINKEHQDALLGVDQLESIWVLWWFDRNDTPRQRSILQVHPFGDPGNPLRGVFATRAPVRPNLIALTRCNVLSVKGNIIEIDEIDAFDDTPILDIKRYISGY
ncbi:MAG: tRNA (N6-threonylcarbamoyladenosine(37)-N6)-methyltransferase TrmO [Sedimenticola sp.]